jgi:hypothetical protein
MNEPRTKFSLEPRTKLSILLEHMEAGRWQTAFRVAARFADLGAHRNAILDAHRAYADPRWTRALGKDPEAVIASGRAALIARYLKGAPS